MKRRSWLSVSAVAAAAALTLTACNANSSSPEGAASTSSTVKGGDLTILTSSTTVTLDPAKSSNLAITTLGLFNRRLTSWEIEPGKTARAVPDLATDTGTPSDDGKTWTYTLKSGLKFSDGTPITAEAVKYGIERSFAPELSGGLGYHKSLLDGGDTYEGPYTDGDLDSIETPDDTTIVFHLNTSYGDWPWIVSMPAFSPVPEAADAKPQEYGLHPVSSGPYQVESYKEGSSLSLSRNPNWDQATDDVRTAGPDTITFELGQDDTVAAQRLIADSGDDKNAFQASFVPPAQLSQIQNDAGAKSRLVTSEAGALAYLAINVKRDGLDDLKVRQALQYAVDKKAFQIAVGGSIGGEPATTLITPGIAGRQEYDLYPAGESGDLDKAKALLAEAGDPKLDLTLLVESDPVELLKAQAIQQGLKRAGIEVTIKSEEYDSWYADVTSDQGDYDLALASWQPDFPSANGNIQPLFASSEIGGGGFNLSRYSEPEVDELIDEASASTDATQAQSLWAEADRRILEDAPVVPLLFKKNSFLHGSNVQNFFVTPFPAYPNYLKVSLGQ
ncbi:ABC transporter substrate-binding protein [Kineosporia sp. J2-2]|uniref:ABC transporter substrate-binding protein n=1 Tax=Kineosporia corallincola TaxID=2835133 RepID=A0ABS5TBS9_9ACTN|nr:ABC transporter substrate-binding protein [Kineosporia corallincola]MBT0768529.1 ABC transporter substrate-binding protein [Kineosporia corallincola]